MTDSSGSSSESPLTRALRTAAGEESAPGRRCRRKRARKSAVAKKTLTRIRRRLVHVLFSNMHAAACVIHCTLPTLNYVDRQGQTSNRATHSDRRKQKSVISTRSILDMCFGDTGSISKEVPDISLASSAVGFHKKTARRARGIISDALVALQEDFV